MNVSSDAQRAHFLFAPIKRSRKTRRQSPQEAAEGAKSEGGRYQAASKRAPGRPRESAQETGGDGDDEAGEAKEITDFRLADEWPRERVFKVCACTVLAQSVRPDPAAG